MNARLKTAALFVLAVWIWSSTWLAIRLGLEGVPPITGAAIRIFTSGVILSIIALALRIRWPRERIYPVHLAVQGSLLFCLQYAIIYWAEQTVPSGLAAVLFASVPIFTAIMAAYIFKFERLSPVNIAGFVAGFCGVAIIYWSEVVKAAHAPPAGIAALLVASAGASFAIVFAKRYAHDIAPLATVAPGQLLGGSMLGVLALIIEHGRPIHFTPVSAGALIYLTIFGSCIVFLVYFTLMKTIPITKLSVLNYVIPVMARVLGIVVAHERLAPATFVGSAAVLGGIWLVNAPGPAD